MKTGVVSRALDAYMVTVFVGGFKRVAVLGKRV